MTRANPRVAPRLLTKAEAPPKLIEKIARAMAAADSGPEGSALFDIHWREFGAGYIEGAKVALPIAVEACANVGQRAWPRAHTYASENADIYRAGDHAAATVVKAIRAIAKPDGT